MLHDDPFLAMPDLSEEKVAKIQSMKGLGTMLRQFGPFKRMAVGAGLGAAKSMLSNDDEGVAGGAARGAMVGAMIPTGMIGKGMGGKSPRDLAKLRGRFEMKPEEIAARKRQKWQKTLPQGETSGGGI